MYQKITLSLALVYFLSLTDFSMASCAAMRGGGKSRTPPTPPQKKRLPVFKPAPEVDVPVVNSEINIPFMVKK